MPSNYKHQKRRGIPGLDQMFVWPKKKIKNRKSAPRPVKENPDA